MKHYFSLSTSGFYSDEDDNIPSDAIEITSDERASAVHAWNNDGAKIDVVNGKIKHVARSLEENKKVAISNLNKDADKFVNSLTSKYPKFEKLTFGIQRDEAMSWQSNNQNKTPNIDMIAKGRGLDRIDLISKIIKNTDRYQSLAMSVAGKRQKYEAMIESSLTSEEINSITFDFS